MRDLMAKLSDLFGAYPDMSTAFWVIVLVVAGVAVYAFVHVLLRLLTLRQLRGTKYATGREILQAGIISRLAAAGPAVMVASLIHQIPGVNEGVATTVERIATSLIIFAIAWAAAAACRLLGHIWQRRIGTGRTLTGFVQVAVIVNYVVAAALILAVLVDRSPLIVISSLGALTAVLVLVFKDTLLSLVASVEIASTNFVRVGDWIEVPSMNANGTVEDFSLYTVQVRNWDKTYSNFPTYALVSGPYINWRGMLDAGGRRIMRSIVIDQSTVRFVSQDELNRYRAIPGLAAYIDGASPLSASDTPESANRQAEITNSTLFRAYVLNHLVQSPLIRQDLTLMVRQLEPGPFGLPLQVYCFTKTTAWPDYEAIQADIFDHLLAMLPQFNLTVFQALEVRSSGLAEDHQTLSASLSREA